MGQFARDFLSGDSLLWDKLTVHVIRHIKDSLILAFKLVFGLIPVSEFFIEQFTQIPPDSSVTSNTRRTQHLIAFHSYAIQPKLLTFGELALDSSERSWN